MNADHHLYSPIGPTDYAFLGVNGSIFIDVPESLTGVPVKTGQPGIIALVIMSLSTPRRLVRFFTELSDAVHTAGLIDLGYMPEGPWISFTIIASEATLSQIFQDAWRAV